MALDLIGFVGGVILIGFIAAVILNEILSHFFSH